MAMIRRPAALAPLRLAGAAALVLLAATACEPRHPDAAEAALEAAPAHDEHSLHAGRATPAPDNASSDSTFARLQERGHAAMGVDQYTSQHRFEPLPDGGRIVLQRDSADTAGARTIRAHMREIAAAFAAGDFATPGFVHAGEVPGTRVMRERRELLRYEARDLPGGAEVRITTGDAEARRAVHEFLAYQRRDHRADPGA